MKHIYVLAYFIFLLIGASCDIKDSDQPMEEAFFKVYDDEDINSSFEPLSFTCTDDGGFVVLAARDYDTSEYVWQRPYVLKTSSDGNFEWDIVLPDPYVSPIPQLVVANGRISFFCMDRTTLGTYLMSIDLLGHETQMVERYDELKYPVYATNEAQGLQLLSYQRIPGNSVFTHIDASRLDIQYSKEYSGYFSDDVEDLVIAHLSRRGKQYPFFIQPIHSAGLQTTGYALNTFYNYSFAMLFVNASDGAATGVLSGYQYDTYTSAGIQINDSLFALSKTDIDRLYINTRLTLNPSATSHINTIEGIRFRELDASTKVLLDKFELKGRDVFLYAGSTQANQIALYYFEQSTGMLIASKYLGSTYPVEVADILKTMEGGIAILVKVSVLGKFDRIGIYKLPPEQLGF